MSGHFEAKNYMYRKNKDGIIVGLVVHPNDTDEAFAALPIGARLMIAWSEIGDDEKPIGVTPRPLVESNGEASLANEPGNRGTAGISKPKRMLSQRCALTCDNHNFRQFIAQYEPELFEIANGDVAGVVRSICGVMSRSEFDSDDSAARRWVTLDGAYQMWLTDQRHAESIRR